MSHQSGDLGDRYWPGPEDTPPPLWRDEDAICCCCGDPACPGDPSHTRPMGDGKGGPCGWCGSGTCIGEDCIYIVNEDSGMEAQP